MPKRMGEGQVAQALVLGPRRYCVALEHQLVVDDLRTSGARDPGSTQRPSSSESYGMLRDPLAIGTVESFLC